MPAAATTAAATTVATTVANDTPGLERAWWPVAMAHEVGEQPLPVQLLGRWWALVRLAGADGPVSAFEDRCPHRLAPLSIGSVVGGELRCGYHGWRFDGTGSCTAIPALGPDATLPPTARVATPWAVREHQGLVWIAPESPIGDLADFPEWDDPTFERSWNEPRRTPVGAHQLVDNFLDATHLPVVHTGTFGVDADPVLPPFEVAHDGWSVGTTYRAPYKNFDDPLVATGEHELVQPHELTKWFSPGATALVRLHFPVTGKTLAILFACQPETAASTRLYKLMARDDGAPMADTVAFEDQVLDEDLAVLEPYRHRHVHLDARAEVHTKADRLGVAFRRLVAEQLAAATRAE